MRSQIVSFIWRHGVLAVPLVVITFWGWYAFDARARELTKQEEIARMQLRQIELEREIARMRAEAHTLAEAQRERAECQARKAKKKGLLGLLACAGGILISGPVGAAVCGGGAVLAGSSSRCD